MSKEIFIDTWAWLALANKKDCNHEAAKLIFKRIKNKTHITSDFILDEFISLLFKTVSYDNAVLFIEAIFEKSQTDKLQIITNVPDKSKEVGVYPLQPLKTFLSNSL